MPRLYDLDIAFLGIAPRIWRRVRVPADLSLADLHHVIQLVMDWRDYHLHLFEVAGKEYSPPSDEESDREQWAGDDADVTVAQALARGGASFEYVYDFGDEWRLGISIVDDVVAPAPAQIECVGGELATPPEDAGGPHLYRELLTTWERKGRRGLHKETREWLPEDFDPMKLDLSAINDRLREVTEVPQEADQALQAPGPEERLLSDLTLLVLFLGSWEEKHGGRMAWKTVRFETLDALQSAGFLATTRTRKSVIFTDAGIRRARALHERVRALLAER
jgi:hypothetical protein